MGANNYILALHGVSALMAVGCTVIPGGTRFGKALCLAAGLALIAWPATTFLVDRYFPASPAVAAVPAILLCYGLVTAHRYLRDRTWCPSPAGGPGWSASGTGDRRGAGRRVLPGEFSQVPVNHAPPRHDPWAALYAAEERERLRGSAARTEPDSGGTFRPHPHPRWFLSNIEEVSKRDAPRL